MSGLNQINISERKILLRFSDFFAILIGILVLAWSIKEVYFPVDNERFTIWLLTYLVYFYFFAEIFEMYELKIANDKIKSIRSVIFTITATNILFFLTPVLSPSLPPNRLQLLFFTLAILVPMVVFRWLYVQFIFSPRFNVNKIVIAPHNKIASLIKELEHHEPEHRIIAYFSDKKVEQISHIPYKSIENDIDFLATDNACNEVVIYPFKEVEHSYKINEMLLSIFKKGIKIKSSETYLEELRMRISRDKLNDYFYEQYTFSKHYDNRMYLGFMRIIDIIISVFALLILTVLLPLIFLINLLFNKGALFYTQQRIGKNSKPFKIYKLRTMIPNAENGTPVASAIGDKRITTFGRFLRGTRLDELPQMFNVLIGNMSLIGPRPERPEIVEQLAAQLPFYDIRHVVKPGITGWAQVNYPYASTFEEQENKLLYDLYYIKEKSLYLDFLIFLKTFNTILFMKGR